MKLKTSNIELSQLDPTPLRAAQIAGGAGQFMLAFADRAILANSQGEFCTSWELPESMRNESMLNIHCFKNYAAIVEARGISGVVFAMDDPQWKMDLSRKDYHCNHCTWPIGFFMRDGKPNLIHATQWNRLDITTLDTGTCITEREIDQKEKKNYLDYFHSSLYVSPDEKHFVVNGWCWSPWDVLYSWNIDRFKTDFEPGGTCLDALQRNGYNWDRPCCFIDNDTIAWGYNEREANEPGVPEDQGTELVFQNIHSKAITRRMPFEYFDLSIEQEAFGRLWFDSGNRIFVCSSRLKKSSDLSVEQRGTSIVDSQGNELQHWPQIAQFVSTENQTIGFFNSSTIEVVKYSD